MTSHSHGETSFKSLPRSPRILSVQSHVVSGYCGNKSATFPLQLLEFEMDIINSVQLSNHTQYKSTKGQIFKSDGLKLLHSGLKENNLLRLYDCVLSGYVADISYIESMAKLIADIKATRKAEGNNCFYTLDPVLGDDGVGFYVPSGLEVADAYKGFLLPLADIITPNRFEASVLTGIVIDPQSDNVLEQAFQAINAIHEQMGVQVVAITSLDIKLCKGHLVCIVSNQPQVKKVDLCETNAGSIYMIKIPKLDCPFTGTGDLFTALLSGWLNKTSFNVKVSLENTCNTIHDILEDTLNWYHQVGDNSVQSHELRLVQNRDAILRPSARFKAHELVNGMSLSNLLQQCNNDNENRPQVD